MSHQVAKPQPVVNTSFWSCEFSQFFCFRSLLSEKAKFQREVKITNTFDDFVLYEGKQVQDLFISSHGSNVSYEFSGIKCGHNLQQSKIASWTVNTVVSTIYDLLASHYRQLRFIRKDK